MSNTTGPADEMLPCPHIPEEITARGHTSDAGQCGENEVVQKHGVQSTLAGPADIEAVVFTGPSRSLSLEEPL